MSARTFWYLSLALVLPLLFQQTAHAETLRKSTKPQAVHHFDAGVAQYKLGNWQAALDEFTKSALVEITPATDFNMAQCYRMLAEKVDDDPKTKKVHLEKALWLYQRFLKTTRDTPQHVQRANENVERVQAALAELKKQESTSSLPSATPASAVNVPSTRETSDSVRVDASASMSPRRSFRPLAWGLTGAGVVGAGIGGGLLWNASTLRDEANGTRVQSERDALFEKADTRTLVGTVITISGGVLLAAGVITFVLERGDDSRTATAWAIGVSPHGVFAVGHF